MATTRSRPRLRHHCLAVCTPGLESVLAREVRCLGIRGGRTITGGVLFSASTRELYASNVWLRTATRVLVRIARFKSTSFAMLEEQASAIDWGRWIADGRRPGFRVSSTKSKLYHTGAIAERLARAAGWPTPGTTRSGVNPVENGEEQERPEFVVRVHHDDVTVSINSSGRPLYQRGWRGPQGKAPLRETLAAAMLLAVDWDGSQPLLDPMCGSGTIAIEAALLARNIAPGAGRAFAFGDWPCFEPGTWSSVAAEAAAASRPPTDAPIWASDRDEGAVDATSINAERAGVRQDIDVACRSISDVVAPYGAETGWLITNAPYGRRVTGHDDRRNLFARLGQIVRTDLEDWRVGLLVSDVPTAGHSGLLLRECIHTTNGGIDVRYLVT